MPSGGNKQVLPAEMGTGRADWGSQVHRTWKRGWRWASLFHFMQTLTHTLRDLKNTLTHMTSVPHLPMRHRETLG